MSPITIHKFFPLSFQNILRFMNGFGSCSSPGSFLLGCRASSLQSSQLLVPHVFFIFTAPYFNTTQLCSCYEGGETGVSRRRTTGTQGCELLMIVTTLLMCLTFFMVFSVSWRHKCIKKSMSHVFFSTMNPLNWHLLYCGSLLYQVIKSCESVARSLTIF